ncbi:MAG TPA: Spy/CpxP family protein refolding chaperone [Bryobacteraceae bacterium]|nr:Spy/CpxP family protein refolding chaperone [Bryobacteraceae bacterium]
MKKLIATFALSSMLVTPLVLAQSPGKGHNAANMVQHRVNFLTTVLSLTTAQQQQATTIFTTAATAHAAVSSGWKAAHQALNTAVKNNDSAGIEQAATTIGSLTAQRTGNDAKAEAAFYQILTADQQAKWSQLGGGFGHGAGMGAWGRGAH